MSCLENIKPLKIVVNCKLNVWEKLKVSMGKQKLVDSAEALQKTVICRKSDVRDSTESTLSLGVNDSR